MKSVKDCFRKCSVSFNDDLGNLFITPDGKKWNSNKIKVLHTGVDTIKQLINCVINVDVFEAVKKTYEKGRGEILQLHNENWVVTRNYKSGFQYTLNNNDGVIVHLANNKRDWNTSYTHLKIELSPLQILSKTAGEIDDFLWKYASLFAYQIQPRSNSIHICIDFQGWKPPKSFEALLKTRANKIQTHSGILEFSLDSEMVMYGRGQSYRFGSASGLQFAVYNKSIAVQAKKEFFWHDVWKQKTVLVEDDEGLLIDKPIYDPNQDVWRIEARFHQEVVSQFVRGIFATEKFWGDLNCVHYSSLAKHLTGLWRYALNNFRLDYSRGHINPAWQFFRDDICFYETPPLLPEYVRVYKELAKELTLTQVERAFKGLMRVYAKLGYSLEQVKSALSASHLLGILAGFYDDLGLWWKKDSLYHGYAIQELLEPPRVYPAVVYP